MKIPRATLSTDSAAALRFEHEVDVLRHLHHPHVPGWLADGTWDDRRVLAVEHVESITASQLMARRGQEPLPPAAAVPLIGDVLRALQAAHDVRMDDGAPRLLLHRDVSPQNILVDLEGRGHLIDFGASTDAAFDGALEDGTVVGKVAYMAPEIVSGSGVGPATDQFAAGIVLWELLSGRRLFRGESERLTWKKVMRCDVPRLDHLVTAVPRELALVVQRMLHPRPEQRFACCADAALAVAASVHGERRLQLTPAELARPRRGRVPRPARTVRLRPLRQAGVSA